ncbi:hypothetical protein K503DRAFT_778089, partial [Rhizopogon vinicolor AM-OR11-026]
MGLYGKSESCDIWPRTLWITRQVAKRLRQWCHHPKKSVLHWRDGVCESKEESSPSRGRIPQGSEYWPIPRLACTSDGGMKLILSDSIESSHKLTLSLRQKKGRILLVDSDPGQSQLTMHLPSTQT